MFFFGQMGERRDDFFRFYLLFTSEYICYYRGQNCKEKDVQNANKNNQERRKEIERKTVAFQSIFRYNDASVGNIFASTRDFPNKIWGKF